MGEDYQSPEFTRDLFNAEDISFDGESRKNLLLLCLLAAPLYRSLNGIYTVKFFYPLLYLGSAGDCCITLCRHSTLCDVARQLHHFMKFRMLQLKQKWLHTVMQLMSHKVLQTAKYDVAWSYTKLAQ